jgi:hypothetical protein
MSSFQMVSIKKQDIFMTHNNEAELKNIVNRSNEMNGFDTLNLSGCDMYHGF